MHKPDHKGLNSVEKQKTLIVVVGPTAVGKTQLAVELAQLFSCEIISTDSRQFYKEMSIGTAKPTAIEMKGIPHHFINNLSIKDDYSAGQYEIEALKKLDELFLTNDYTIAVGGSGLFVNALCFGLDDIPSVSSSVREKWNTEWETRGAGYIQEKVKEIDPDYFNKVDINNKHRLLRALEVWEESGKKLSEIQQNKVIERPFNIVFIGLNEERSILYNRINKRVDLMLKNGLLSEVKSLKQFKNLNPLRTVGYQEFYDLSNYDKENHTGTSEKIEFQFENESVKSALELIKRNSRRYAKRQITWFKKMPGITWFSIKNIESDAKIIQKLILDLSKTD